MLAAERGGDVGGCYETATAEHGGAGIGKLLAAGKEVDESVQHADAAVAGGGAAQSHHQAPRTAQHGVGYEFAQPIGRGLHGVELGGSKQMQPAGCGTLKVGSAMGRHEIARLDAPHEGVVHGHRMPRAAAEGVPRLAPTLAAIAEHEGVHAVASGLQRTGSGLRCLLRSEAAFIRIESQKKTHEVWSS